MYKYFIYILVVASMSTACKTVKKSQVKQPVINAEKVQAEEANSKEKNYIAAMREKLASSAIAFNTFSAKLALSIANPKLNQSATGNLRIEKDKRIWVSVTGPFGIEVFRAMATPDSVTLIDKLQNKVVRRNISYLQQALKVPLDFYGLQDLLMGNAILSKGNIDAYKAAGNVVQLFLQASGYNNTITMNTLQDERVELSNFQITETSGSRSSNITYDNYTNDQRHFPQARTIDVNDGKEQTIIKLQYKDIAFDQQLSFPFSIPCNFNEN